MFIKKRTRIQINFPKKAKIVRLSSYSSLDYLEILFVFHKTLNFMLLNASYSPNLHIPKKGYFSVKFIYYIADLKNITIGEPSRKGIFVLFPS